MRRLGLALYAEGSDDYLFLPPLLRRAAETLCCARASQIVEIGEVIPLKPPETAREEALESKVFQAAKDALGAFEIFFLHADGGGDADRAREQRIIPATMRIRKQLGESAGRSVAVVPVREMEAWTMADGDALRRAFGTSLDNAELKVPSLPREVERIRDPKFTFNQAFDASRRRRQRRKNQLQIFSISSEKLLICQSCVRFLPLKHSKMS